MKPKYKRLIGILLGACVMAGAAYGILNSFKQELIFFYTPTQYHEQLADGTLPKARAIRLGGVVKPESVYKMKDDGIGFIITDLRDEIHATYHGILPSLFREGQGVVAQGRFDADGIFNATLILAKHDENYMPQQVVDELKQSGQWQRDYKANPLPKPAPEKDSEEDSD